MPDRFRVLVLWLGATWLAFFIVPAFRIPVHGIIPRSVNGLPGIFTAPFLHGDLNHLIQNSVLYLMIGVFYLLVEKKGFPRLSLELVIGSGLFTWVIGSPGQHLGASGLIFGLWSYLLFRGWFHYRLRYILGSVLMVVLYGSLIYGIFPTRGHISWEAHLGGFLTGIWCARLRPSGVSST